MNAGLNWTPILIFGGVVAGMFLLKRSGQVSAQAAQTYLKQGALVIDVRTPGEFNSGHLPTAINIPLDEITARLPQRVGDKSRILLLHCQSGMRSGVAKNQLKGMGYANVYNLGSLGRARAIVGNSARR